MAQTHVGCGTGAFGGRLDHTLGHLGELFVDQVSQPSPAQGNAKSGTPAKHHEVFSLFWPDELLGWGRGLYFLPTPWQSCLVLKS